jgi:hypothetical protein
MFTLADLSQYHALAFILFTHFCYKAPPAAAAKTFDLADFLDRKVKSSTEAFNEAHEIAKRNPQSPIATQAKNFALEELRKWAKLEQDLSDVEKK